MRKIIQILLVFLALLSLGGCFGFAEVQTEDCPNETPNKNINNVFWGLITDRKNFSTKEEFLNDWGKPDEIIAASNNTEVWIYGRKRWCGWIPAFIVPVPLLLPVCDGFDKIEFQRDKAVRLHTRRTVMSGAYLSIAGPVAGRDPNCRLPLRPDNDVVDDPIKPSGESGRIK